MRRYRVPLIIILARGLLTDKAPELIETERLVVRRPGPGDCEAIFERYASDATVVKYVGWPQHRSLADTRAFLALADAAWREWPAGPYLVLSRDDGSLLGGTGLDFETPYRATTGYVLAKDAWGRGIATEALLAMVDVARALGVLRLQATCHPDHVASRRVLEKSRFECEGILRRHAGFPNLEGGRICDVCCYARILANAGNET